MCIKEILSEYLNEKYFLQNDYHYNSMVKYEWDLFYLKYLLFHSESKKSFLKINNWNYLFTSLSNLLSNFIIFDFPKHKRSSFDIFKMNRVLTELASSAPISSSKVALSCKIQSNLKTSCSSGRDVVFLRSLRINCVLLVIFEVVWRAVFNNGVITLVFDKRLLSPFSLE